MTRVPVTSTLSIACLPFGMLAQPPASPSTATAKDRMKRPRKIVCKQPVGHASRIPMTVTRRIRRNRLAGGAGSLPRPATCAPFAPMVRSIVMAALALTIASCGGGVPRPPIRVPPDVYVEVPYPPPPARVELIPDRPRTDAVWIDGGWSWIAGGWVWLPGAWIVPPPGAWYAPWAIDRASDGRLFFSPSSWRAADGRRIPAPAVVASKTARSLSP